MSCGSATLEDSSLEASSSTVRCLQGTSGRCVLGTDLVKNWYKHELEHLCNIYTIENKIFWEISKDYQFQ
jgi:hypothetical protein